MQRRNVLRLGAAALPTASIAVSALALDAPTGPVVLTVFSRLRDGRPGNPVQFDMAMLERLPQTAYSTRTPWYGQACKFSGPLLRDVLSCAGLRGSQLRLEALNAYRVDIPFDDVLQHDVLLARLLDDKPMAVRDKGPLFVIYPFEQHAALRNAVYHSRCVWQLRSIEVS